MLATKGSIDSWNDSGLRVPRDHVVIVMKNPDLTTESGFFVPGKEGSTVLAHVLATGENAPEEVNVGDLIALDNAWAGSKFEWKGSEYITVPSDAIIVAFSE